MTADYSRMEITPVFRVRIDFTHPKIRPASTPDGNDFEFEGAWRDRCDSLMDEIHFVANTQDADEVRTDHGVEVAGVDPYVLVEFDSLERAQAGAAAICETIVKHGGEVVSPDADEKAQEIATLESKIVSISSSKLSVLETAAVKSDGLLLKEIPYERQTRELCAAAIRQHGGALRYACPEILTPYICQEALDRDYSGGLLEFVPVVHQSMEMYRRTVLLHPYALKFVPDDCKTLDMCQMAVEKNPAVLAFVPESIKRELEESNSATDRPRNY